MCKYVTSRCYSWIIINNNNFTNGRYFNHIFYSMPAPNLKVMKCRLFVNRNTLSASGIRPCVHSHKHRNSLASNARSKATLV